MYFPKIVLRLVSVRSHQKDNKAYAFVKLANKETFDAQDFMLAKGADPALLTPGVDYEVVLEVEGKYSSVHLSPVAPVAK